jgi:dTDP-4-dehydrorhamnose 3,5-epimerase
VRAVVGEIFDVAVDIRVGSASYGEWVSALLSAENQQMLYVPAGFAHGFCVLSEVAEVSYKATEEYSPEHDAGIRWDDPEIGIEWPIDHPVVSAKDAGLPLLSGVTSAGFGHQ